MSKKKFSEDPKPSVPGYIVTFSDMITLLLTFFVMLLSMAETQVEKHKFEAGIYSFRRAIADFGISGLLMSRSNGSMQEHPKVYYRVDAGEDKPEDRSIDAKTEMLRRVMMDIEQIMKISPSQIMATQKTSFPTTIQFTGGGWELRCASSPKPQKTNRTAQDQLFPTGTYTLYTGPGFRCTRYRTMGGFGPSRRGGGGVYAATARFGHYMATLLLGSRVGRRMGGAKRTD